MEYRVKLKPDTNGTVLVTFPDLPGVSYGKNAKDALTHGLDALITVLEALIKDRQPIPAPSAGPGPRVRVPALLAAKIVLHNEMLAQHVSKSELGRRLNQHMPQIDRLFDMYHGSKLDQLEAALGVLGKQLEISVHAAPRVAHNRARQVKARLGRRRSSKSRSFERRSA